MQQCLLCHVAVLLAWPRLILDRLAQQLASRALRCVHC